MKTKKQVANVHNEWFQQISKTTCPCGAKKTTVFAWGEYVRASWRTVDHFCQTCFAERVIPRLVSHMRDCGCEFKLQARSGHSIPDWIKMPETKACVPVAELAEEMEQFMDDHFAVVVVGGE